MSDPGVTDRAKASAMAALGDLGEPEDRISFLTEMRDPQKLSMDLAEEMLSTITTDQAALEALIWQFQGTPSGQRSEMIRVLGSVGDARILRLLLPLPYAREVSTTLAAIEPWRSWERGGWSPPSPISL